MPLQPKKITKFQQIKIKQYYEEEPPYSTVTPLSIYIYKAHPVEFKQNTSLAEVWTRMQIFNKMNGFVANYYIDKITIWNSCPNISSILKIVICDDNKQTYLNTIYFIKSKMIEYKIPQSRVKIQFKDKDFKELLFALLHDVQIESPPLESFIENNCKPANEVKNKNLFYPRVDIKFYSKGKQVEVNQPFSAIQINTNTGNLIYRVFINNQWTAWTSDKICGANEHYIQGFQYEYKSDKYKLMYRCNIKGRGWLNWKEQTLSIPYNKDILGIELKIEVK